MHRNESEVTLAKFSFFGEVSGKQISRRMWQYKLLTLRCHQGLFPCIHSILASFLILTPGVVIHLLCKIKCELLLFFFLFLNLPGSRKPHFQWAWESCGSWWDGGFIPMVFLVVSMLCSGTVDPYYGHLIIVVQQKLSQSISTPLIQPIH